MGSWVGEPGHLQRKLRQNGYAFLSGPHPLHIGGRVPSPLELTPSK